MQSESPTARSGYAANRLLPPMLDYRCKVFQAVAAQLNFTRAAEALHISQPAVTQHIKALEEHYGAALFRRGTGGITLTPAGQTLLAAVGRAATLERETERVLRNGQPELSGPLRLGASTTVAQYFLPQALGDFLSRHPAVELTLRIGNTREVTDGLRAGRLDLGLIEGPAHRRDLQTVAFFDDEIVCVAGPQHPLAKAARVNPAALASAGLVLREPGSGTRDVVERALRQAGLRPQSLRVILETEASETIKGVVATGAGVAFLSRLAVEAELARKTLVAVAIEGLTIRRPFFFVLPQGPRPTGPAGAFMSAVEHRATTGKR